MKASLTPSSDQSEQLHPFPSVTVEIPGDDHELEKVIESLVKPLLRGWGFSNTTIDRYFES